VITAIYTKILTPSSIVHAYFGVDTSIIWFIIENELSILKKSIAMALEERKS